MRLRCPTFLVPLVLALASDVAPGACEAAWPAPTNLVVEIKDGFTDYVSVTWTADPNPHDGLYFSAYIVERRDDTAGGGFETMLVSTFQSSGLFTQGIADPSHNPPCSNAGGCVEPGHTYTYRVIARFGYSVGCPLHDGNLHDAVSAPATLVVPGGSAGAAPTNVIAIADSRKPRVTVTWTPPSTKPDRYVIKRRRVTDGPPKGPKETEHYVEVGTARDIAKAFVDKDVAPDETYEYVVEAILAGETSQSIVDRAFSLSGRCPKSEFHVWNGRFHFESGGQLHEVSLHRGAGVSDPITGTIDRLKDPSTFADNGLRLHFVGDSGRTGGSLDVDAGVSVLAVDGDASAWGAGLAATSAGKLLLDYVDAGPFDPVAFRRVRGTLVVKTAGSPRLTRQFEADRAWYAGPDVIDTPASASLCATFAAGTSKPVAPGDEVVFVYQLLNLGPHPLFSRRAMVRFSVTNGELVEAVGGMFSGPADLDGAQSATFAVGAIGPRSQTKSEVASLVLRVRVATPAPQSELTVTAQIVDTPAAPFSEQQVLTLTHPVRVVEIPIGVPVKR